VEESIVTQSCVDPERSASDRLCCNLIFFCSYFQDGLKTIEHFGGYVADLSVKLHQIRQKQEEERRNLSELRAILRSSPGLDKEVTTPSGGGTPGTEKAGGYSLHQLQGDKHAGLTRTGRVYFMHMYVCHVYREP